MSDFPSAEVIIRKGWDVHGLARCLPRLQAGAQLQYDVLPPAGILSVIHSHGSEKQSMLTLAQVWMEYAEALTLVLEGTCMRSVRRNATEVFVAHVR